MSAQSIKCCCESLRQRQFGDQRRRTFAVGSRYSRSGGRADLEDSVRVFSELQTVYKSDSAINTVTVIWR
jgi:hypothetical protein